MITGGYIMAGLDLTPIEAGRGGRKALDEIPAETAETVEEAYAYCLENANRLQTPAMESKDAVESWLSDARAYAYHRPAGRLTVSGNAARSESGSAKFVARFRVETYKARATGDATS